jgi:hypothetical protein
MKIANGSIKDMFKFRPWAPSFVVCLYVCTLPTASALTASSSSTQSPTIGNCPVFPADNVWNVPVDQLSVSSYSASWVGTIGSSNPLHPDFGSDPTNGIPFITVSGSQTKYPATFEYSGESDPGPYATPLNAPIEGGSGSSGDRHVISVDTDNCILYEMWSSYPQASSWNAGSGAIMNLTSDALRPSGWTSADAAGLPVFPGLVRYDEVASGQINHALRFTVPQTQNTFLWPARHFASSLTGYQYPPMGARFRLRADFDISHFSPMNQVILTALKKYGMILADNGSSWFISGAPDSRWNDTDLHALTQITGSAFEAVDESSLMVNSNSGQTTVASTPTITISINPTAASVTVGSTAQFAATVTNATSSSVTWSVNGIAGGNGTVGTISSAGLYTAPATVPSGGTVTVQATSTASTSTSASGTVTITAPQASAPVLSSISPSSGTQGNNITVTLNGANFQSGASVGVGGSGISISSANVLSASQIQAVLSIGSSASTGADGITVTTSAGTTAAQPFMVSASAAPATSTPTLTSISPSTIKRPNGVLVTLTGTGFTSGAKVSVLGLRITLQNVTVVNSTTITAKVKTSLSTPLQTASFAVTTSAGTSNSLPLTVF